MKKFTTIFPRSRARLLHRYDNMNVKLLKYCWVIVFCLIFCCTTNVDIKMTPKAVRGVIDLSNWDFDNDGPIDLSGEYEFFWNQLISPQAFLSGSTPEKSGFIVVPGFWHTFKSEKIRPAPEGYATYRLRIVVDPNIEARSLAIKYMDMGSALNLFLNGNKLCSVGKVGKTRETSQPKYHPGVTDFQVDGSNLDLIMQVSNFHHRRGGAWKKLTLGKVQDLRAMRSKHINYDVFLFGSILVMAFYHLGLFFLRRKEKSPIFFSAFCFLISIRILTTGERYLMELFPAINWQLLVKLEYLSFYLSVPVFTQFVYQLFPDRFSKKFCNIVNITSMVFSAIVILLPVHLFSHTLPAYQLFTLGILFYALYVLIIESLNKEMESIIFLAGFIIIFLAVINDILNNENIIQTANLLPLGLFLFIFSQAFLQSLRFSRAFSTVDSQRRQMRKTNQVLQSEVVERQLAEKELKESHKRFLTVLDSIDADVYVADMDTYEILFMNHHMIESFNKDYTGQICWKVFRNESGPCSFCTNDKLLNNDGEPGDLQIWEDQNPVTRRWYVNYDRAINWDQGHIVRLQVATDVTSRKLAEEALKEANEALEKRVAERTDELLQANEQLQLEIEERKQAQESSRRAKREAEKASEAKSEFLANMSHELRTPLNHILGFTELILDGNFGELNQVQTEYLSDVHTSGSHLLSLINDILDLSKIEAGKDELEPSIVNLQGLLENSLTMIKEKALKHGITLSKHFTGLPDTITADERKLKQIMYNLLSNAVKFTPDGGNITVKASPCDNNHNDVLNQHQTATPGIKISINDTGIGIKSTDLERIFDSFEQVENSASRNFQGTGLGLSLTKKLVELHGGKIWVESEGEGLGATFSFTLPL